jgi:hypothetical protein
MSSRDFVVLRIVVLVLGYALGNIVGLVLAAAGLFAVYLISVRLNPRIPHGRCGGTGRRAGWMHTWTHHRDSDCNGSGRVYRPGARWFGMPAIRNEVAAQRMARANARANRAWR